MGVPEEAGVGLKGGVGRAAGLAGALRVTAAATGRGRSAALAGHLPAALRTATLAALTLAALLPPAIHAQNTHILLISGLGGDPEYTVAFHSWLSRFADAATEKYGVPAERITYLGEKTELDPTRIRARVDGRQHPHGLRRDRGRDGTR